MALLLAATNLVLTLPQGETIKNIQFNLHAGQHWLLLDNHRSQTVAFIKCLLGEALFKGEYIRHTQNMEFVPQSARFKNNAAQSDFYYQQRYHSTEATDAPTLMQALQRLYPTQTQATLLKALHQMNLMDVQNTTLLMLSNGEQKKFSIAQALLATPDILILDHPFEGLDTQAQQQLQTLLHQVSKQIPSLIMIGECHPIPSFITHTTQLTPEGLHSVEHSNPNKTIIVQPAPMPVSAELSDLIKTTARHTISHEEVARLCNVSVQYETQQVLHHINWNITCGEHWQLHGPNGSGKSTLLSLLYADHPQIYQNDIRIFGKQIGQGHSIWSLKKNTGLVSIELQHYFYPQATCLECLLSGYFDTIGLFTNVSSNQIKMAQSWLSAFRLTHLENELFIQQSTNCQRLLLLARALIKSPALLIVDEICQGLSGQETALILSILDQWSHTTNNLIYVSHQANQHPRCINKHFFLSNREPVISTP